MRIVALEETHVLPVTRLDEEKKAQFSYSSNCQPQGSNERPVVEQLVLFSLQTTESQLLLLRVVLWPPVTHQLESREARRAWWTRAEIVAVQRTKVVTRE
ncbi:hypothetical protein VTI28DRAFT_7678 [Corynascus sepedonium]